MYRYIGNKTKLLPYIMERTEDLIGNQGTVADIMAGTGLVSLEYRKKGYRVVASDMMTYCRQKNVESYQIYHSVQMDQDWGVLELAIL